MTLIRPLRLIVLVLPLCLFVGPAAAAERDYDSCVALTAEEPAAALESARRWRLETGDLAARHCVALALVALERYDEAAAELTSLAADSTETPPEHQAALFSQSAHAWFLAGQFDLSEGAFERALELTPNNVDLLIDRAGVRMAGKKQWDALADLDAALAVAPDRADALIERASIHRRLGSNDMAAKDVSRALAIDPNHPQGLLERGILSLAANEIASARRDFGTVLVTAPKSDAAAMAQEFLAELDRESD